MALRAESLEQRVIHLIQGGWRSREVLEAEYPEHADALDDDRVMLCGWSSVVHREGMALAHLSVIPSTRAELHAQMPVLLERVPIWLDALANKEPMTAMLFARGFAEVLAVQRAAIERVGLEQVEDPESIWAALAEAPVPAAESTNQRELMEGVGGAMIAQLKALVAIARDLEAEVGAPRV